MSLGVYHGIKLNHFLGRLADVWNQNPQVTIFNHGVKTKQQMYSDIPFMNDLWQEKVLIILVILQLNPFQYLHNITFGNNFYMVFCYS